MFELYTETRERPLRERSPRSKLVSIVGHAVLLAVVIVIPLLRVTSELPPLPTMMAFVAAAPEAPPPPPPPPPPAAAPRAAAVKPVETSNRFAAPLDAPSDIQPERGDIAADATAGVVGGIEGGVPGGVLGGIVGGIVTPAPPPPPPPPAPRAPVRVGGQITTPALLHRVEPVYPDIAATAHVGGIVILEAVVKADGCVESVRVLRSRHPLLDEAAVAALKQWQYSPLVLNGIPTPFVLTVTFTFNVQ